MWAGYTWMLTFGLFFAVLFAVMQWLTHGFVFKFMRVKGSREKKIMVKIRSKLGDYIVIGKVREREVIYKKRHSKHKSTLSIPVNPDGTLAKVFYRFLGVYWCDVDEEKNSFCTVKFNAVQGFDDERQEGLIIRAMMRPSAANKKEQIIMILLIVIVLGLMVVGVMVYQSYDILKNLNTISGVIP
jgi:hypothetical protein